MPRRISKTPGAAPEIRADGREAERGASISRRLTFLLHRLVAVLIDATAQEFRAFGLSIPAARSLVALFEAGGVATVGSLSETTSIDLSTISHILRRLEAQRLVTRERQEDDNRIVCAVLTKEGRKVAEQCRNASLDHEAVLLRGVPPSEIELFKQLLEQAYENAKSGF
jgi:MarR family transcriptional regulator, organic hydroperoxide resistance regulator